MACINPKKAWWSKHRHPETGNLTPVFRPDHSHELYGSFLLPCGKCQPCLAKKVQAKCIQCVHEMHSVKHSCFLTLTYDDDHLVINNRSLSGTLVKEHLKQFHKSLRKRINDTYGKDYKYKYFQSGEYGGLTGRPHYHVLLMGYDFPDKTRVAITSKRPLYDSETLNTLWKYGHVRLEDAGIGAASYIAKYAIKEYMSGNRDLESLETTGRIPQYITQSRQIGKTHLHKYAKEFLQHGTYVTSNMNPSVLGQPNKGLPLSKWQLQQLKEINPDRVDEILSERKHFAIQQTKPYQTGLKKTVGTSDINLGAYVSDVTRKQYAKYKNSTYTTGVRDTETKQFEQMLTWSMENAMSLDPALSPLEQTQLLIKEFKSQSTAF